MQAALRVEGMSKQYRLGQRASQAYYTLRETLVDSARGVWGRLRGRRGEAPVREDKGTFWALKDVSFEVKPGEVVGIVGRNGAGKSTLLKILSRITEPTSGRAVVRGRLGSLLEVGTGFHPELTGRENIYLNGAILGMTSKEIDRRFDEIVAFSEIEKFLDTPVKRYSSGMYVRLAFAVAAHLEPETLIVDEVLAVGDVQFQKKCLGKMHDVAGKGRTVLFVSHNMTAVQGLCTRVIWLNGGRVAGDGPTQEVVPLYLKTAYATQTERVWDDPGTAPGNDKFRLRRVSVRPADAQASGGYITVRTPLVLEFEYWNLRPDTHLNISLHVYNDEGVRLFNTGPVREPVWHGKPFPAGLFRSSCIIPGNLLNDGTHRVQMLAVEDQARVIHNYESALVFDVSDEREETDRYHGKWPGAVRPDLDWATELLAPGVSSVGPT